MVRVTNALPCNSLSTFHFPPQACARPLISVYSEKGESSGKNVVLPAVFRAPIRPDVVNFVHTNMRKNSRQPYAVSELAGECTCRSYFRLFDKALALTYCNKRMSYEMYNHAFFRSPDQC